MTKPLSEKSTSAFFFIASTLLITCVFSLCAHLRGIPVLPQGPSVAVSEVTKSMVRRGTLTPTYFSEVYDQLIEASKANRGVIWQDIFAFDASGNLLPKHSILSAMVAVPFFFIFGDAGFWIMQQVALLSLLYATYVVVRRVSGRALPCTTLVCTLVLTPTLFYSHTFSYDLHGCALIIGGLALSQRYPFSGALVMSLSVFVRPSYALLSIPLLFAHVSPLTTSEKRRLSAGLMAALLMFFLYNTLCWGGPFLTSYARMPEFRGGEAVLSQFNVGPNIAVFLSDWPRKLVGEAGLLPYNLCLVGLPIALAWLRGAPARSFYRWCLGSALVYMLYIFSYQQWMVSHYGNRFLLPAIYLYLIVLIPAAADMMEHLRRRGGR